MKDTKDQIIDIAEELIMTKGYNGFSYNDISETIGIRKASIHYHFKTKADLASAVIRKYQKDFLKWCGKQDGKPAMEKLKAFGELYKYLSAKGTKICPIGMLSTEYAALPPGVQRDVKAILNDEKNWLIDLFASGKKNNEFTRDIAPEVVAEIIQGAMMGIVKNIRINKNINLLDRVDEELKKILWK